jgi:hypothetical protein
MSAVFGIPTPLLPPGSHDGRELVAEAVGYAGRAFHDLKYNPDTASPDRTFYCPLVTQGATLVLI